MLASGCRTTEAFREEADEAAYGHIERAQQDALGRETDARIEPAEASLRRRALEAYALPTAGAASLGTDALEAGKHWPDDRPEMTRLEDRVATLTLPTSGPLKLGLDDALRVAAANNRDYQRRKEDVFRSALRLDLEANDFRNTWDGRLDARAETDLGPADDVSGVGTGADLELTRRLKNGIALAASVGVDLVQLFNPDTASSRGVFGDASITLPLMRGSGRHIVTEGLTQAERDLIYAIWEFERFKRSFAVGVASDYLDVVQQRNQLRNTRQNYESLVASARRARRLADAGRLPEIQVDQAVQNELRARDRWVSAEQGYERQLDNFKEVLGMPADMPLELLDAELARISSQVRPIMEKTEGPREQGAVPPAGAPVVLREPSREGGGPLEIEPDRAVRLALENRLDLRAALGRVEDAQRGVVVAADALRPELTLLGRAGAGAGRSIGSANSDDAGLDPGQGQYSALLTLDPGLERTAERNSYRNSLIELERAVRSVQSLEDTIKLDVRARLRDLVRSREGLAIQALATNLAQRRVRSTNLFLQAGRAEIRDLLEAQEDLLSAENALSSALVDYRVTELQLQRDMGLLQIGPEGLWTEYRPETNEIP